ncbi:PGC-1 and ERR-induced regulator in muscle protein 1 [Dunckerocampus dactyliophorus]|uniref:PGC-1 and ERR-induced regulator in muscle protein 1 n=1 Tax=Dunckerocampus dactyliophorus TaxID=161453 RepID=UPI0024053235|nr:PGC-1 and ERR-induced regulator in muscle protein 1 [Dunckerocampus dactyliophorus]
MEDFEFSVEICDRDWQCFYEECEECNLHPPLLATGDDSGLSDGDDTKSAFVESTQKIELKKRFPEADYSLDSTANYTTDSTPDCKSFPVKTGLRQQAITGMESTLSCSEEDIHLQSVNMFFEGITESRESKEEVVDLCHNVIEVCCDQPARGETIVGKGNDISKINTVKKAQPGSQLKTDIPFNSGSMESRTHKATLHRPHDLPDDSVCSEVKEVQMCPSSHLRKKDHAGDPPNSDSSLTSIKRKRRKKRRLSVEPAQSEYDRQTDEEQDLSSRHSSTRFLCLTEAQEIDLLVTNDLPRIIHPSGSLSQHERRGNVEHKDDLLCETDADNVCCYSPSCDAKLNLEGRRAEVILPTEIAAWDDDDDAVEGCQGDKLSTAKSVLAAEALHSVRDKHTGCQREAEPQQQMEMEGHSLDQNTSDSKKADFSLMSDTQMLTFSNTDLQTCETKVYPMDELTSDLVDSSVHKSCLSQSPSSVALKETEHHKSCDDNGSYSSGGRSSKNTRLLVSPSEVNIAGSSSSPNPMDTKDGGGKTSPTMPLHQEADHDTGQLLTELKVKDGGVIPTSRHEHPVFVMSSFWREMEKLTINDILGLRNKNEETSDSGCSSNPERSTILQIGEDTFGHLKAVELNPVSTSSKCVLHWESEPKPMCDVYPKPMKMTSLGGFPGHVMSPKGVRKISKNVSVHNLRALDSESCSRMQTGQSLQTLEEGELEKVGYFSDGGTASSTSSASSTHSYSFSLLDIFQYFFGGNQEISSQSVTDDIIDFTMAGNSVSETYDHFFSQFDTNNFFCPFITEEKHKKSSPVTSGQTKLHFPEAYDYFFVSSSSSDDSSEEEEDESCGPVRVVSRLSQKADATHTLTDIYENFFSDGDMRDSFFWKMTFSLRNVHLSGGAAQNKTSIPSSPVHMSQNVQSLAKTTPLRYLAHVDSPDPLILQREDTISKQISARLLGYEELQRAVPSPSKIIQSYINIYK